MHIWIVTALIWVERILILSGASVLAGLFLGVRDLLPYMAAQQSGVIIRRGYAGIKVRRDEDAERFSKLLGNRIRGMAFGFGFAGAAAIVFVIMAFAMARYFQAGHV